MGTTIEETKDVNLKIRVSPTQKKAFSDAHSSFCAATGTVICFAEFVRRAIDIGASRLTIKSSDTSVKTVLANLKTRRDTLDSQIKALENGKS